jgi:hypothetical protein
LAPTSLRVWSSSARRSAGLIASSRSSKVADREQAGSSPAEHELLHDAVLVVGQVSGQFAHGRQRVLAMTEGDLDAPVAHAVAPSRSVAAANASSASRNAAAAVAMLTA